jgi:hypothetical protein
LDTSTKRGLVVICSIDGNMKCRRWHRNTPPTFFTHRMTV